MSAVYKRELAAYFISPIGYIFMAVFFAISGAMVWLCSFYFSTVDTSTYFFVMQFFFIILIPILTMRLLSEERRSKTEQILLTSPVGLYEIVAAKFFAAYTLFAGTVILSLLNFVPLYFYGAPNTAVIISNTVGILFIGAAFIAIGLFISALTESQFVAVISTIAAILGVILLGTFSTGIKSDILRVIIKWISVTERYNNFMYGLFDVSSILYYVSVAIIFIFLTVRIYEKRRWS